MCSPNGTVGAGGGGHLGLEKTLQLNLFKKSKKDDAPQHKFTKLNGLEFRMLVGRNKANGRITKMDFKREDFVKGPNWKYSTGTVQERREVQENWLIVRDHLLQDPEWSILPCKAKLVGGLCGWTSCSWQKSNIKRKCARDGKQGLSNPGGIRTLSKCAAMKLGKPKPTESSIWWRTWRTTRAATSRTSGRVKKLWTCCWMETRIFSKSHGENQGPCNSASPFLLVRPAVSILGTRDQEEGLEQGKLILCEGDRKC